MKCPSTEAATSQALAGFDKFQVLVEANRDSSFYLKQWADMEGDIKDMQRWLSSANIQMNNMTNKIKHNKMNSGFLLTCLKDVVVSLLLLLSFIITISYILLTIASLFSQLLVFASLAEII